MKKALFALALAAVSAAGAGQVRGLPDIHPVNSDKPVKVCSVTAVKLSDHALRSAFRHFQNLIPCKAVTH